MARLSPLQHQVLAALHAMGGDWFLFGGAALLGAYADHRTTRDLDLQWPGREVLAPVLGEVDALLRAAGLDVEVLQTSPAFSRWRVALGGEVVVLDLVATAAAAPVDLTICEIGGVAVRVPSRQGLLADKLCALLSRAEVRDLQDVRELLRLGAELDDGVDRAAMVDGGFSPLTLAWVVRNTPFDALARAVGLGASEVEALTAFRDALVDRLAAAGGVVPNP